MVQAKELQKGNYVFYNTIGSIPLSEYRFEQPKELCLVAGFEEDKIVLQFQDEKVKSEFSQEVHTNIINISPIRLTPEIIEACQIDKNKFSLSQNDEAYQYDKSELKYLHQLQNVYAEATGHELLVNL